MKPLCNFSFRTRNADYDLRRYISYDLIQDTKWLSPNGDSVGVKIASLILKLCFSKFNSSEERDREKARHKHLSMQSSYANGTRKAIKVY